MLLTIRFEFSVILQIHISVFIFSYTIQRRHTGIDITIFNQLRTESPNESVKQVFNVSTIDVSITFNDNLAISEIFRTISEFHRLGVNTQSKSVNHCHNLSILLDFVERGFSHIKDFTTNRQNCLGIIVSREFQITRSRVTLCNVNFALFTILGVRIGQFTVKLQRLLSFLFLLRTCGFTGLLRSFSGLTSIQRLIRNQFNFFLVRCEPVIQIIDESIGEGRHINLCDITLNLSIICYIRSSNIKDDIHSLLDIITRKIFIFFLQPFLLPEELVKFTSDNSFNLSDMQTLFSQTSIDIGDNIQRIVRSISQDEIHLILTFAEIHNETIVNKLRVLNVFIDEIIQTIL